jgi:molecular chaperone DnaK
VAVGAAIQAGVLGGDVTGILLLDVTPLSLGIETMGGVFTRLIDRNTTIPAKKSQFFSTAADNQTSVEVNDASGRKGDAQYNKSLGRFHLDGIAPPAAHPADRGHLRYRRQRHRERFGKGPWHRKRAAHYHHIFSNMSKEDIEKAVKEAEQFAAEDAKRKDEADARNHADQAVYQAEQTLREMGDKIDASDKADIESAIQGVKDALTGTDIDNIKTKNRAAYPGFLQVSEKLPAARRPAGQSPGRLRPQRRSGSGQRPQRRGTAVLRCRLRGSQGRR